MKLLFFMAFVILYSVFLFCLLVPIQESTSTTTESTESINITTTTSKSPEEDSQSLANQFVRMIGKINEEGVTVIKILLGILTGILAVEELFQAYTIGLHYFQEMENYIEWMTIICAFITVGQEKINTDTSEIARGFSAIGICLAYLELIFLFGRYPFQWCDFGIMFYRILIRLLRYVFALFLIIVGHTFAFTVNMHSLDEFKSPWKGFVTTLTR